MATPYQKCRVAISTDTWTAIVAPFPCNYFGLKNSDGTAMLIRTDQTNPLSEDTLSANGQELVDAPHIADFPPGGASTQCRFPSGATACWVKATSGVGPVVVTWVS